MGGGTDDLLITMPRPLPFIEEAMKTSVLCSRSHSYFQGQNQDQKPKFQTEEGEREEESLIPVFQSFPTQENLNS